MNTQELRRLGVLPYEDTPSRSLPPRNPPADAWFAPTGGVNRRRDLGGMTVTRQQIQPRGRTLRANWTLEPAEPIINISGDLEESLQQEIDTSIIGEINETVIHDGIQPNPFDDDDFEDINPLQDHSLSRTERALEWLRRLR